MNSAKTKFRTVPVLEFLFITDKRHFLNYLNLPGGLFIETQAYTRHRAQIIALHLGRRTDGA